MRTFAIACAILATAAGVAAAARPGQDAGFKPGREHEFLKQFEGTWDVTGRWWFAPGQEPTTSTGSHTAKMSLNGLWLVLDYEGDMMGGSYQGHGCQGYDPAKKQYVMTWIDSMGPMLHVAGGTLDASGKVLTLELESREHPGRWTTEVKDANSYVFTLSRKLAEGKYERVGELTYKRKK